MPLSERKADYIPDWPLTVWWHPESGAWALEPPSRDWLPLKVVAATSPNDRGAVSGELADALADAAKWRAEAERLRSYADAQTDKLRNALRELDERADHPRGAVGDEADKREEQR